MYSLLFVGLQVSLSSSLKEKHLTVACLQVNFLVLENKEWRFVTGFRVFKCLYCVNSDFTAVTVFFIRNNSLSLEQDTYCPFVTVLSGSYVSVGCIVNY